MYLVSAAERLVMSHYRILSCSYCRRCTQRSRDVNLTGLSRRKKSVYGGGVTLEIFFSFIYLFFFFKIMGVRVSSPNRITTNDSLSNRRRHRLACANIFYNKNIIYTTVANGGSEKWKKIKIIVRISIPP